MRHYTCGPDSSEQDLVPATKGFQSSREGGKETDGTVQSGKCQDGIKFVSLQEHISRLSCVE